MSFKTFLVDWFFFSTWTLWCCLNMQINDFHQVWKFFSHYFFKYSFSVWNFHYLYVGMHGGAHRSVFNFLPCLLFLFFQLHNLGVCLFFLLPIQICYWAPLVKFSFELCFSTPKFLFGLKMFFLTIDNFWWDIILIFLFSSLEIFFLLIHWVHFNCWFKVLV